MRRANEGPPDGAKMGMQMWQRYCTYQMADIMMVLLLQRIKHRH